MAQRQNPDQPRRSPRASAGAGAGAGVLRRARARPAPTCLLLMGGLMAVMTIIYVGVLNRIYPVSLNLRSSKYISWDANTYLDPYYRGKLINNFVDDENEDENDNNNTTNNNNDATTVSVGRQGPAVQRGVLYGLDQRMKGFPRNRWDTIENPLCIIHPSSSNNNSNNNINNAQQSSELSHDEIVAQHLPQAILIGVQKGGTTALYKYLDQHPDIAQTTKELYFLDEQIDAMMMRTSTMAMKTQKGSPSKTLGIPQQRARDAYSAVMTKSMKRPARDARKMILDLTPNYIFQSDRLPARIKCIVPWAKIFCLLRNPINRARSQYDMKVRFVGAENQYNKPIPTFDEYVQNDIRALQETGVLQDWNAVDFEDFWNSPAIEEAWRTYLNSGLNAPVGMGLYVLQLKPFLDSSDAGNNDFLAIKSEDLQAQTNITYARVLDFLGLPPHSLTSYPPVNYARRKHNMSNETVLLLRDVFAPFNRKLAYLLGEEWEGVWE